MEMDLPKVVWTLAQQQYEDSLLDDPVHCFTYIRSAVEAPRVQWQAATRDHSFSPTRPRSKRSNGPALPQPFGSGLFSAHAASLSRYVSQRIRSSPEPKIAPAAVRI